MNEDINDMTHSDSNMNDNTGVITYIMLGRIYDQLTIIGDALGKGEDMLRIMDLHRQGHLMSPLPSLATNEETPTDEKEKES